jgi:hypothetical protein
MSSSKPFVTKPILQPLLAHNIWLCNNSSHIHLCKHWLLFKKHINWPPICPTFSQDMMIRNSLSIDHIDTYFEDAFLGRFMSNKDLNNLFFCHRLHPYVINGMFWMVFHVKYHNKKVLISWSLSPKWCKSVI